MNVTASDTVGGTLGYLEHWSVAATARGGVLTWLPNAGDVIRQGQSLFEVDGRAVPLWYGTRPAWRDFRIGMPDGPDVAQLQRALVALGFGTGLTVGDHFTARTAAAISVWQHAHHWPRTGQILFGQVAFQPGPVRVAAVAAALGTPVQPGLMVLAATSTTKAVTVTLDPTRQAAVRAGEHVTLRLPTGRSTTGTVSAVGVSTSVGGAPTTSGTPGSAQASTTTVTVTLDHPAQASGDDAGTVRVSIVTAEHDGVLAVPIDALLAAPGGGYRVAVIDGGQRRLVTVHTGLFDEADGVVEVAGDLDAGATVEVPAS